MKSSVRVTPPTRAAVIQTVARRSERKKKCRGYPSQLSSNEINNKEKKSTRGSNHRRQPRPCRRGSPVRLCLFLRQRTTHGPVRVHTGNDHNRQPLARCSAKPPTRPQYSVTCHSGRTPLLLRTARGQVPTSRLYRTSMVLCLVSRSGPLGRTICLGLFDGGRETRGLCPRSVWYPAIA